MLQVLRRRGGRAGFDDLARHLFEPWRAEYERRQDTGVEASWSPHLRRLRRATGSRARDTTLLAAWLGPWADQVTPLAGARAALETLVGRGLRLGLVSNVPLPGALYERAILRRHRMLDQLAHREWSYDAGRRKPSPAIVRAALAGLRAEAADAIMVGDRRSSDVVAGRLAGLRATVWIRGADGPGPHPTPDHTIESISELPALVASM
jgi:FMN phosphatase YigB (HAD superfamily)